jgi:hypothetical protein
VLDDVFTMRIISVDELLGFVNFIYLEPDMLAKDAVHQWCISDFERDHKPVTKLHKLLKGIE